MLVMLLAAGSTPVTQPQVIGLPTSSPTVGAPLVITLEPGMSEISLLAAVNPESGSLIVSNGDRRVADSIRHTRDRRSKRVYRD